MMVISHHFSLGVRIWMKWGTLFFEGGGGNCVKVFSCRVVVMRHAAFSPQMKVIYGRGPMWGVWHVYVTGMSVLLKLSKNCLLIPDLLVLWLFATAWAAKYHCKNEQKWALSCRIKALFVYLCLLCFQACTWEQSFRFSALQVDDSVRTFDCSLLCHCLAL